MQWQFNWIPGFRLEAVAVTRCLISFKYTTKSFSYEWDHKTPKDRWNQKGAAKFNLGILSFLSEKLKCIY